MIGLDLDGTLLTCRERQVALMGWAARALALPLRADAYWAAKCEGASNAAALAAQGLNVEDVSALCSLWQRDIERWPWLGFDQALPGVEDALAMAAAQGAALHLVTARQNAAHVRQQIARLGWGDRFASVSVVRGADLPAAKARAMQLQGCRACIGDTEIDAEAGRHAGIPTLLVATGMRSATWLRSHIGQEALADLPAAMRQALASTRA